LRKYIPAKSFNHSHGYQDGWKCRASPRCDGYRTRCEYHSITILDGDTDITPDCGKTSASRQTYVTGSAAKLAGVSLRKTALRKANVSEAAELVIHSGKIIATEGETVATIDLKEMPENEFGYVLMAEETYDPPTKALDEKGQGIPYAVYGYGAQMMELTVDTKLGTQGVGLALMEDYFPGRTENLHDYLIPTFGDMPEFENLIIEVEDAEGPYGAKGLGEHVLIPTAPAILNAIRDATGAVVSELPATPDKVMTALKAMK